MPRLKRDLFTGEWVEEPFDDSPRPPRPPARIPIGGVTPRHKRCRALDIPPEQATPDRIAKENEDARRRGTGAGYSPDGVCHLSGDRAGRAKEMRRRRKQDNDAGFGDYAGPSRAPEEPLTFAPQ